MLVEDLECERLERRVDGRDLGEDVDAVAVLLDHPLDAADLALDSVQAFDQSVLVFAVAVDMGLARRGVADLGHVVAPWLVSRALRKRLRRRLFETTNRLEA